MCGQITFEEVFEAGSFKLARKIIPEFVFFGIEVLLVHLQRAMNLGQVSIIVTTKHFVVEMSYILSAKKFIMIQAVFKSTVLKD